MESDTKFKVAKIISEQANLQQDNINEERTFEQLGLDELDQIEIVMKVEELFHIEITDDEVSKILCVKDLISCVNKNIN